MEFLFIFKILFFVGGIVTLYAIARNIDILEIIFIYWKDSFFSIFRK